MYPLIGSGTFSASGSVGTGTVSGSGTGISALIGAVCTTNDTSIPLDSIMDENFMNELGRILKGAGGVSGGYTRDPAHRDILSGSGATGSLTSANDFFDQKGSCGGIFCIDVRFIGGSQATLGGGKNRSIEGIIDKHSAILEPIAAGNLACQKMTKNMGQSPNAYLKLVKVFSGLKVIYMTKPQETKQFRSEVTPQTEADDLLRFQQCAYASAGLSTNLLSANGPRVGAYSTNSAMNTENFTRREIVTSPQDPSQNALGASCFDLYMDQGRTTYYASFMNNITEIEGFTRSIADTITILVNNGTTMDSKPSGC